MQAKCTIYTLTQPAKLSPSIKYSFSPLLASFHFMQTVAYEAILLMVPRSLP